MHVYHTTIGCFPSSICLPVGQLVGERGDWPLNYVMNMGVWFIYDPATGRGGDGATYPNSRLRPCDFSNGLSCTLCTSEVKAYTPYYRNVTLGGLGASGGPSAPVTPGDVSAMCVGGQAKMGPTLMNNTGHTDL